MAAQHAHVTKITQGGCLVFTPVCISGFSPSPMSSGGVSGNHWCWSRAPPSRKLSKSCQGLSGDGVGPYTGGRLGMYDDDSVSISCVLVPRVGVEHPGDGESGSVESGKMEDWGKSGEVCEEGDSPLGRLPSPLRDAGVEVFIAAIDRSSGCGSTQLQSLMRSTEGLKSRKCWNTSGRDLGVHDIGKAGEKLVVGEQIA